MRKRLFVFLLAGFLLALSACGNTDTEETNEATNIATEEAQDEETASTESKAEEVTDAEADATEQTKVNQESKAEDTSEDADTDYVQLMFDWADETKDFRVDLYEDGKEDTIELAIDDAYQYAVSVNDRKYVLEQYATYFSKAFLVKKDGNYYIYMQLKYNNFPRVRSIEVFWIHMGLVFYQGSINGQLMEFEDPESFIVRYFIDESLVEVECYVNCFGLPDFDRKRYKLIQYDKKRTYDYISLVDIPAELVDEQGHRLARTYNIPAGTEFLLMYTDFMTYYDVKTDDGRYCRYYIEKVQKGNESYFAINGLPLDSCMVEFPKEQESKVITPEDMFEQPMGEAYQEKYSQLLPYVSDDTNVCKLSGEFLQCNVKKRKAVDQWVDMEEVEFVVENTSVPFHNDDFEISADTLEWNIKEALGRSVGEAFVLHHHKRDLFDDKYRYTILEIKKNSARNNVKETVEYGDTIRAIRHRAEGEGGTSEYAGSFLMQVNGDDVQVGQSDYTYPDQLIKKIEKEALKLPLSSGDENSLLGVGFDIYDEEYVYSVSVTAIVYGDTPYESNIPEGWSYQFAVPKIGSFKEYTEDSPACPVDMEGGIYFGYEDRLADGCSTWCACNDYYCKVTASSSLAPQGTQTYGAENLKSANRMNAWAEGVPGDGIGEIIEIREMYFGGGDPIFRYNEVCIVNGYAKDETTWLENNRVKSMKLYFMDEYIGTITLEDTMLPQYIDLSQVAMRVGNGCEAKFLFEITDVYKGTKYDDTCISGIVVEFEGRSH